jgi:hypothetical protein
MPAEGLRLCPGGTEESWRVLGKERTGWIWHLGSFPRLPCEGEQKERKTLVVEWGREKGER